MIRKWREPFAVAAKTALYVILGSVIGFSQGQPGNVATSKPQASESPRSALLAQYCSGCHNEKLKSGGMSLAGLDLVHPERNAELAERVIRKLNAGLMPPAGRAGRIPQR